MDDPNVVSPGILGFLAFFLLAVALYFLLRNMNGHLRRMNYRAEEMAKQEQVDAELGATAEPAEPAVEEKPADEGEPT
jgi:hypothetical protein